MKKHASAIGSILLLVVIVSAICWRYIDSLPPVTGPFSIEQTTTEPPPPPITSGSHVYWDTRTPMLGFLEEQSDDTYKKIISAIEAANKDATLEKFGYQRSSIEPINFFNLYETATYATTPDYDQPSRMTGLLNNMQTQLENRNDALTLIVTCTWYDNAESAYHDEQHGAVKPALKSLLEAGDGRALLYFDLPWKSGRKALFILAVGTQAKVFDFCDKVIDGLVKMKIKPNWVINDYSCPYPLFLMEDNGANAGVNSFPVQMISPKSIQLKPAAIHSDSKNIDVKPLRPNEYSGERWVSVKRGYEPAVIYVDIPYRSRAEKDHNVYESGLSAVMTKITFQFDNHPPQPAYYEFLDDNAIIRVSIPLGILAPTGRCKIKLELHYTPERREYDSFMKKFSADVWSGNDPYKTHYLFQLFSEDMSEYFFSGESTSVVQVAECLFVVEGEAVSG